MNFDSEENFY